jgi:putative addiction module CopG family antidote
MPASYSLGAHFEDFVKRQVRGGRFASASEVVREGLRLIEARDAEREARLEALRGEIARGRDSGPGIPADETFARARERTANPATGRPTPERDAVIALLRGHEAALKAMGVARLSLFGSVARGEAGPESDIDLAAEIDPDKRIGLFRFEVLRERIEDLLGAPVDLLREPIEKPRLRQRVDQDRVHVF